MNVEQWAANKAVHCNEWANFGKVLRAGGLCVPRTSWLLSVQRLPIVALC